MIKRYVLAGAAHSGKTPLLNVLAERGFNTVPEVATQIIESQLASGGKMLPWIDRAGFDHECLRRYIENYSLFKEGIIFFDRAHPDCIAYNKVLGSCPDSVEIVKRYRYDKAFLLARLPDYNKDRIRRADNDFEDRIQQALIESYNELNIPIIHVPVMSIADRVKLVLENLD